MKTFSPLILVSIVFVSVMALPTFTSGEVSVGVKKGDWIEYAISMAGPALDSLRNLTWYRTEILEVDGASFQVNKTALSVNGTFSSSIWNFDLTEGQVYGWVIIPANLSMGDKFFDAANSANITIKGEVEKTMLGASRTVTHASDPGKVYKEWDKTTGVYVYSMENTANFTVIFNAIATNMWSPQIKGQNPTATYQLSVAIILLAVLILSSAMFIARKRRPKNHLRETLLAPKVSVFAIKVGFDLCQRGEYRPHSSFLRTLLSDLLVFVASYLEIN
jgi:hypothetical protein